MLGRIGGAFTGVCPAAQQPPQAPRPLRCCSSWRAPGLDEFAPGARRRSLHAGALLHQTLGAAADGAHFPSAATGWAPQSALTPCVTYQPQLSFASRPSLRGLSSHARKRRRTTAAATAAESTAAGPADAASPAPCPPTSATPHAHAAPSSAAAAPPRGAATALGPAPPALRSGLGQVVAAASNFMRVEVHTLLPEDEPTPPDWWPAHLRRDGGAAAAATEGGSASAAAAEPPLAAAEPATPPPPPVLLCSVRSLLSKLRQDVVVGDVVRVGSIDWAAGRGVVAEVLPRSSRLVDPSVANVDHVLLVFALDRPPFEEQQVSRFLVAAEAAGLPFSLILNKADLVPPAVLQRRLEQCRSWGYDPIVLSCETGEGVEQVAGVLQGRISVVAGPSGAGKSSLINCLRLGRHRPDLPPDPRVTDPRDTGTGAHTDDGADADELLEAEAEAERKARSRDGGFGSDSGSEGDGGSGSDGDQGSGSDCVGRSTRCHDAESSGRPGDRNGRPEAEAELERGAGADSAEFLAVGSLSKMGRGMHTTTAVRLLRLRGGGWLADTPGFGQPTLDDVAAPQLAGCFPELSARVAAAPCRFADCLHVAEPGCSVSGSGLERYAFYLRFLQEIKSREASDVTRLQRARAEREGFAKAKSVRGGGERLEARLDVRKHRRTSRSSAKQAGRRAAEGLED